MYDRQPLSRYDAMNEAAVRRPSMFRCVSREIGFPLQELCKSFSSLSPNSTKNLRLLLCRMGDVRNSFESHIRYRLRRNRRLPLRSYNLVRIDSQQTNSMNVIGLTVYEKRNSGQRHILSLEHSSDVLEMNNVKIFGRSSIRRNKFSS